MFPVVLDHSTSAMMPFIVGVFYPFVVIGA